MIQFENLPQNFKNDSVFEYYKILEGKKVCLIFKRCFDFVISVLMFVILLPVILILSVIIKCSSKGPVFYKQVRIGRYGKEFKIFKFRTMVVNADKIGTQITVGKRDPRVTAIGYYLRKFRLDELPQLINVILGDMTLVGARPEVKRYVDKYTDEMMATLLLSPGVTGLASLEFKDENEMLDGKSNPEDCYINEILPVKMGINLEYIKKLSLKFDLIIILRTVKEVLFN